MYVKIYIEFCVKSQKFCGRPQFPNLSPPPRPQTSALADNSPSLCGSPLWTAPKPNMETEIIWFFMFYESFIQYNSKIYSENEKSVVHP